MMKIRPYLTFDGECEEAITLYKHAFQTEVLDIMYFKDLPPNPDFSVSALYQDRILQATLKFGDDFIRLSDCGPGHKFNGSESERISLAIETNIEDTQHAFAILAEKGRVGIPLAETFYSPCAGVVFDKFGVMWNFSAVATVK